MTVQRISVVMEWENVHLSAEDRVGQVLGTLASQADELADAVGTGSLPFEVVLPLELLLLYDSDSVDEPSMEQTVRRAVGSCPSLVLRAVPVRGENYFGLKNEGARRAHGDLVIYLDSDVIPQPGWLNTLIGSFADAQVSVVASRAFVRPQSLFSRTVALTWFFELPPSHQELRAAEQFHANGVAFRRNVILAHPFPKCPGQSRGAGWELFIELAAAGIKVYEHTGALLDHPPPLGLWNYCRRARIHGSDDRLSICRRLGSRSGRLGRSIERTCKKWLRAISRLWHLGEHVGLKRLMFPAAVAQVTLYFGCYMAGDLLSRCRAISDHHISRDNVARNKV
jgi:hypothetical protein